MIISVCISVLALILSSVCLYRMTIERKANAHDQLEAMKHLREDISSEEYERKRIEERIDEMKQDLDELKSGSSPDYEEAVAAAKAVNDFNRGLSSILGYDPAQALKASRQERSGDA